MTFIETIQYIRNRIAAYFSPAAQAENTEQSINTAMISLAGIAVGTAQAVENIRVAGLALATNPDIITAVTRVSNVLGIMQADAEAVWNAVNGQPLVVNAVTQSLPVLLQIRAQHEAGVPSEQLIPLMIQAISPAFEAIKTVASTVPGNERLLAAGEAAFAQLSANQNLQNKLMTALDAMYEMVTRAYLTREVNAADATRATQTLQAAILALASLVDTTAESAIQAHTTTPANNPPILNAAPNSRRRRQGNQEHSTNNDASNDEKISDTIASRLKRRKN